MSRSRVLACLAVSFVLAACEDDFPAARDVPCAGLACPAACGDGVRQLPEECDLGEDNADAAACTRACLTNRCGDGLLRTGFEACDDGNAISGDGCDANCTLSACGNGIRDVDELCDDGNTVDGDGCNANCRPTACEAADNCAGLDSQCMVGFCNPRTGTCEGTAINEGLPCGAGCGAAGQCRAGACAGAGGASVCDDGDPCTDDVCGPGGCEHPFNTGPCGECGVCNLGGCDAGANATCDDGDPCTRDRCMSNATCQHTPENGPACN